VLAQWLPAKWSAAIWSNSGLQKRWPRDGVKQQ